MEEHERQRQPFLIRITDYHQKALERQIVESLRIEEGGKAPEESLNLKSEWAASKLPSISVRKATRAVGRKEEKRVKYRQPGREGEIAGEGEEEAGKKEGKNQ